MNQQHKRFTPRAYARFPARMSMLYLARDFAGQGIVCEISRVGCRVLGNDPVVAGEAMSVRISLLTYPKPLVIEQATVRWVKGLEFGVAFDHLDKREAHRMECLMDELLSSKRYS
ncbi:MAG: PilZ domain-containing protein [Nitrospiraceae bacterium]